MVGNFDCGQMPILSRKRFSAIYFPLVLQLLAVQGSLPCAWSLRGQKVLPLKKGFLETLMLHFYPKLLNSRFRCPRAKKDLVDFHTCKRTSSSELLTSPKWDTWKRLIGVYPIIHSLMQLMIDHSYCEAIGTSIRASNRGSQFYTPTFIGELKNLSDRLTAAPQVDKTASWISKKMTKPSLDTLGSWLEGSFSKLIIGEGEESVELQATDTSKPPKSAYGPFSHYSTISSTATSAIPSRTSTPYLPPVPSGTPPVPFVPTSHGPVDRAASAMDHLRPERHRASPVQRVASASAATTTFSQASAMSQSANDAGSQEVSWWGQDRNGPTPTATTFHKVDEGESEGNFISFMDNISVGPAKTVSKTKNYSPREMELDGEDEDLGFGNSSTKKVQEAATPANAEDAKKTEDKSKEEPKKPGKSGHSLNSLLLHGNFRFQR